MTYEETNKPNVVMVWLLRAKAFFLAPILTELVDRRKPVIEKKQPRVVDFLEESIYVLRMY
jgi:hypothetical protein